MAGGQYIVRVYDFVDGQILHEYHLDDELNRIHTWLNGKIGDLNIAPDANINGSKLMLGSINLDRLSEGVISLSVLTNHKQGGDHDLRYYTKDQIDTILSAAALGSVGWPMVSDLPAPEPGQVQSVHLIKMAGVPIARFVFALNGEYFLETSSNGGQSWSKVNVLNSAMTHML